MMNHRIEVENIKCGGCATTIRNKVSAIPSVTNVVVHIEDGIVQFDSDQDDAETNVLEVLKRLGYPTRGDGNVIDGAKSIVSCMVGRIDNKMSN